MQTEAVTNLQVFPGWVNPESTDLLHALRSTFEFDGDRATGYLYGDGLHWQADVAPPLAMLLALLERTVGVPFTIVAFQAYRNGSGCDWHADTPFDAQAVLSLGATRTFGVRLLPSGSPTWISVKHGDLVYMPPGFQDEWEHCVPVEPDKPGERVSLVFRTPRS